MQGGQNAAMWDAEPCSGAGCWSWAARGLGAALGGERRAPPRLPARGGGWRRRCRSPAPRGSRSLAVPGKGRCRGCCCFPFSSKKERKAISKIAVSNTALSSGILLKSFDFLWQRKSMKPVFSFRATEEFPSFLKPESFPF